MPSSTLEYLVKFLILEVKKPSGTAEDIERYFGCPASLLVMVGILVTYNISSFICYIL